MGEMISPGTIPIKIGSNEEAGRIVPAMALKEGWQGRVFEDFEVGDVYRHPLGRTITQTDNIWFTLLTVNNNPIHFDAAYAARTEWGRPLVDSTLTLAIATGLSVTDISRSEEHTSELQSRLHLVCRLL